VQNCATGSYAPLEKTGCVEADGGKSCTAKELTIDSATIVSPTLVGGGSLPVAGPCCKNPNVVCQVCLPGQTIKGDLKITVQTNPAQVRNSDHIASTQGTHFHKGCYASEADMLQAANALFCFCVLVISLHICIHLTNYYST
jgi:hypothetical protein